MELNRGFVCERCEGDAGPIPSTITLRAEAREGECITLLLCDRCMDEIFGVVLGQSAKSEATGDYYG